MLRSNNFVRSGANGLKQRLEQITRTTCENLVLYRRVLSDPRTPWLAWCLLGAGVGYLLLPFDLIPDWIPVIGLLDDLLIVPLLVMAGLYFLPKDVIEDHREEM